MLTFSQSQPSKQTSNDSFVHSVCWVVHRSQLRTVRVKAHPIARHISEQS